MSRLVDVDNLEQFKREQDCIVKTPYAEGWNNCIELVKLLGVSEDTVLRKASGLKQIIRIKKDVVIVIISFLSVYIHAVKLFTALFVVQKWNMQVRSR